MALTHEKRLERFIRQQAFGVHEDKLVKFNFYHAPAGGKMRLIYEFKPSDAIIEDDLKGLIDSFMEVLQSDATGMGGYQRYIIEGEREGGVSGGRFTAKLYGEDEGGSEYADQLDTEGPTTRGIVSQAQRHVEAILKTSMGSMGAVMGHMQRITMQQSEMIERMLAERYQNIQIIEEAMSKKHERELDSMLAASSEERKDRLIEQITTLMPVAANRLLGGGKKLLPEKVTPREQMLKNVVHTLDPSQMESMMAALRPDQQIALLELLRSYQAEEEAKSGNGVSE